MSIQAERLKALRVARGWTQAQLAEAAGITQGTYSRIERGESKGSLAETMSALERALSLAPGALTSEGASALDIQTVPHPDDTPTAGARGEFDRVAAALLEDTPEAQRPAVEATLGKIRRSGSMQSLDIPLTVAALGELVKVVSRHTLHRGR
jgi:transcriptional regulator with XRE-family HTH domain